MLPALFGIFLEPTQPTPIASTQDPPDLGGKDPTHAHSFGAVLCQSAGHHPFASDWFPR